MRLSGLREGQDAMSLLPRKTQSTHIVIDAVPCGLHLPFGLHCSLPYGHRGLCVARTEDVLDAVKPEWRAVTAIGESLRVVGKAIAP